MRFAFFTAILFAGYFVVFQLTPTDAQALFLPDDKPAPGLVSEASVAEPKIDPQTPGGKLFMENCARCHSPHLQKELTGPALWGVGERMDRETMARWIRNSASVLESGDPYFLKLQKKYNGAVMDPMLHLKPEEIEAIIDELTLRGL